jgi:Alkylmercury lyase
MPQAELLTRVRKAIYDRIVAAGVAPTVQEIATVEEMDVCEVENGFRALAESHVVVLKPGTVELWSAPPFSAVPTSFRVHGAAMSWYAPCAWDMFGVPAALAADALLEARCAWSGEPLPSTVRHGQVTGTGVVHLEVPARHFWDDIFYT